MGEHHSANIATGAPPQVFFFFSFSSGRAPVLIPIWYLVETPEALCKGHRMLELVENERKINEVGWCFTPFTDTFYGHKRVITKLLSECASL